MTVTVRVDLTIRTDMIDEFNTMIHNDKKSALESNDGVVLSFDIHHDENNPNDFTLYQTSTSKEGLLKHMKEHFYRWKSFMNTGAVLSYKHTYI